MGDLIARINDDPDPLIEYGTPAVYELAEIGQPAVHRLLNVMIAEDAVPITRLRAQVALKLITMKSYGYELGEGWPDSGSKALWEDFWQRHGDLRFDATMAERRESVAIWRSQQAI